MVRVGPNAGVAAALALPGERLVWRVEQIPASGAILLQVDGSVVRWMPEAGAVVLSPTGRRVAVATRGHVSIHDFGAGAGRAASCWRRC